MTNKPLIELRSIDLHVGLSEETPAYTARLFVDDKHFADVSNQGHGGCDMQHALRGQEKGFNARLNELEERIKTTYPGSDYDFGGDAKGHMEESLEGLCHTQAWESVEKRNLKSRLSRRIVVVDDGRVYTIKGKRTPERIEAVAKQYPNATILNSMKFDAAFDLFKEHTTTA